MATKNSLIMSSLWANATNSFQQRVPSSTVASTAEQFKIIFQPGNQPARNEFIDQLINVYGLSYVRQMSWRNPLAVFKKGRTLEFGQSVLEAQSGWVTAHSYQDDVQELLKVHRPEFEQCIHVINREDQYPISVNHVELRRASMDEYGLNSFISAVMDSVINSSNWDEYIQMRQLIAWYDNNLGFYKIHADEPDDETSAKSFLKSLKTMVSRLQFPSARYNAQSIDSIAAFCRPEECVLLITPEAASAVDVDALATLFNLEKGDSAVNERRIIVDEFPIPGAFAMLTTEDWFQVYDSVYENGSFYNPQTLTTNYYLTVMQVMSCSPFVPAIIWTTEEGTETGTITMTTTNSITPVVMSRDKKGNFSSVDAATEVTRDMVDGKNVADDYDGIYVFASLDGSLSDGDISGATRIGNVTVKPDGYTVKSLAFQAGVGETAPIVNSRTYIDRNGRLHLQAGAYKSENGLTLVATLTPVYTNPSGETPTPVDATVEIKVAGSNFSPAPGLSLSDYLNSLTVKTTRTGALIENITGDSLDSSPHAGGTISLPPQYVLLSPKEAGIVTGGSLYAEYGSSVPPIHTNTETMTSAQGMLYAQLAFSPASGDSVKLHIDVETTDGTIPYEINYTYSV